jgi:hypothetical protein
VARGDNAAFEAVYDELSAPVFGIVKKVLRACRELESQFQPGKKIQDTVSLDAT